MDVQVKSINLFNSEVMYMNTGQDTETYYIRHNTHSGVLVAVQFMGNSDSDTVY